MYFVFQPLSLAATEISIQQDGSSGPSDSRAPNSRLCASSHGVCVQLVHSSNRAANHENILASNAERKNAHRRTPCKVYDAYCSAAAKIAVVHPYH